MTRLLLIMRNTYAWNIDHITLRALGVEVHLATKVPAARQDSRFAGVVPVDMGMDLEETTAYLVNEARARGIGMALTFYESDLVLTAMVNQKLGHSWAQPDVELTSRDKRRQREFLTGQGIPSARFAPVGGDDPVASGLRAAKDFAYPMIIKPTHLSASIGVTLANDEAELRTALERIAALATTWEGYFFADYERNVALIEEFLPGKEVTVDGVALFGRFHLSGVTDKMQMGGPYFEEDLYTLPFRTPEEEAELTDLCQAIIDGLGMPHCLFNAEFRRDAAGRYRTIEFSTRMSGGQNYQVLRECYSLDLVRLYAKAALGRPEGITEDEVWAGEVPRSAPRAATCIKYAYRRGTLVRNNAGDVAHAPCFRSYYPGGKPGAVLREPPEGWYEIAGSLAIAVPYREPADVDHVARLATDLESRLNIVTV